MNMKTMMIILKNGTEKQNFEQESLVTTNDKVYLNLSSKKIDTCKS